MNVEQIEATPFFVCHIFGEDGFIDEQLVFPYHSPQDALERLKESASLHDFVPCEVWTSSRELLRR